MAKHYCEKSSIFGYDIKKNGNVVGFSTTKDGCNDQVKKLNSKSNIGKGILKSYFKLYHLASSWWMKVLFILATIILLYLLIVILYNLLTGALTILAYALLYLSIPIGLGVVFYYVYKKKKENEK